MATREGRVLVNSKSLRALSTAANEFFGLFYQWQQKALRTNCSFSRALYGPRSTGRLSRHSSRLLRPFTTHSAPYSVPLQNAERPGVVHNEKVESQHLPDSNGARHIRKIDSNPRLIRKINYDALPTKNDYSQSLRNTGRYRHVHVNPIHPPYGTMSKAMRVIMRKVPHSVIVLTTSSARNDFSQSVEDKMIMGGASSHQGMTLSSFSTLTLDPEPIVMFSIRKPSRTLDSLRVSRHCLIHLLAGNEYGAAIADSFSRGHRQSNGAGSEQFNDPFSGLIVTEYHPQPTTPGNQRIGVSLPNIEGTGVRIVLHCEIESGESPGFLEVGDHVIVFAKVLKDITAKIDGKGFKDQEHGLGYVEGKYRAVGRILEVQESAKHVEVPSEKRKRNSTQPTADVDAIVAETEAALRLSSFSS